MPQWEGGANNAGTVFEVTDSGFFVFAGTPGKPNCHGRSVWALAQQYGRPRPGERRQTGTAASMPQLPARLLHHAGAAERDRRVLRGIEMVAGTL